MKELNEQIRLTGNTIKEERERLNHLYKMIEKMPDEGELVRRTAVSIEVSRNFVSYNEGLLAGLRAARRMLLKGGVMG